MVYSKRILLIVTLIIGFFCYYPIIAEVTVEPFGFAVSIEEDNETEIELILSNGGEDNIAFSIDYELIEDEEDRLVGPRRDDPGDVLREFQKPYNQIHGLAWDPDNNWMWGIDFGRRIYAIDLEDEEVVIDVGVGQTMAGLFYLNGVLHAGGWGGGANNIFRYDTEGEALERLVLPLNPGLSYIGSDGEHILNNNFGNRQILVFNLDDQEHVATIDFNEATNGAGAWSVEWVTAHPDGQLWLSGQDRLYQCFVDDEWNCEAVQNFGTSRGTNNAIGHDGENLWRGVFEGPFHIIDDGVREFSMLEFEPEEGIIEGEDSANINILVQSEGVEAGVFNLLIIIELSEPEDDRDDLEQLLIEISALITVSDPTFDLSGVVTDAATDEFIENVTVEMDSYVITRFSNDEGIYGFDNLPPGEYQFTFSAPDYLPTTEDIEIEENDVELNVGLLHSECTPSEEDFFMELEPDMEYVFDWEVTNGGNGLLTYQIERHLLGNADADPWELRQTRNVEEAADDNQINGVVFAADHYFISGGNRRE
ncbi:MAG: carboxypeptidase-like regulatory domain-containing protein, partial [Candidatus Hatepunaea meridiana]|nr:carboxypeptidase-like regulatory domain-containing protein [Candidatus Hatepunaea meridiana]